MAENTGKVKELILEGKKIEAIKVYREENSVDLKTAKDEVEKIEKSLSIEHPELLKRSKGCLGIVLFFITFGTTLFFLNK